MGRRRSRGATPGDWKVFCIRGHICMASDAVQLFNQQWVCEEHYEARQPLDNLRAKPDPDPSVPWSRGKDSVATKKFIQEPASLAYVICDYVETGTDSWGGPNDTKVTVTQGGTTTEDHVTGRYYPAEGEYVVHTGECEDFTADNRVVTKA